MANSVEDQKMMFANDVLDLHQKVRALNYLLDEAVRPENKAAVDIFDEAFGFIYKILWDNIVINLCWLYDKKGQRSAYWYLNALTSISDQVANHVAELDGRQNEIKKIKKFRDKWIAHRDETPYEDPQGFWTDRPSLSGVKELADTLEKIVQMHSPVVDLTTTGLHRLFLLVEVMLREYPDFMSTMRENGFLSDSYVYEAQREGI